MKPMETLKFAKGEPPREIIYNFSLSENNRKSYMSTGWD